MDFFSPDSESSLFSLLLSPPGLLASPLQEDKASSSFAAEELALPLRSAAHSSTEAPSQEALLEGVQAAARSTSEPKLESVC